MRHQNKTAFCIKQTIWITKGIQTFSFLNKMGCLFLLLFLTACAASTININTDYPTPLVSKLPYKLGVYYSDDLKNFTYIEIDDYSGKDQYIVNTGPAQVELFDTILPVMFDDVVQVSELAAEGVDAVFSPQLIEFQLGLPQKTKLNVYEIWLKYNMRLTDSTGEYIADWNMTAYGKSPTESFQSVDAGVQNAAEVAMRDLAASFTLGFSEVSDVKDWLQNQGRTP